MSAIVPASTVPLIRGTNEPAPLHMPQLGLGTYKIGAEQVEREVLFAEVLADADGTAHTAGAVIDAVRLGIVDDAGYEGGHDDDCVWLYTPDGIPLEFRAAVPHTHDACAQATDAEEVGQPGHEALVDRRHQLEDAARTRTSAREGDLLVVGQPIQIGVGHGKRHRVA